MYFFNPETMDAKFYIASMVSGLQWFIVLHGFRVAT